MARVRHDPALIPSGSSVSSSVDVDAFKAALGSFATGVTLATTLSNGELHGVTANAVMSVSLVPPLVMLSIQRDTRMHGALRESDNFALSVLAREQRDVALYFADSSQPHGTAAFERFAHHSGPTGAPLLGGAIAHVDCRIVAVYPAGDHILFIGQAVHVASLPTIEPLLYFRRAML